MLNTSEIIWYKQVLNLIEGRMMKGIYEERK